MPTRVPATLRTLAVFVTALLLATLAMLIPRVEPAEALQQTTTPWEACSLPLSGGSTDWDDPFHWHFNRRANLTVLRYGLLRARNQNGLPDFDNFGAARGSTESFVDNGGTTWRLLAPSDTMYHQPEHVLSNWISTSPNNPNVREPKNRYWYPNRVFIGTADSSGQTFELVIEPDGAWNNGYTYNQQKMVLNGPTAGTYNYADLTSNRAKHVEEDIAPHRRLWATGSERRSGDDYQIFRAQHALRQNADETAQHFRNRVTAVSRSLVRFRQLSRETRVIGGLGEVPIYLIDRNTSTSPTSYRLRQVWTDKIETFRPETYHAIGAYLDHHGLSCDKSQLLSGTWTGTFNCTQGRANLTWAIDAEPGGKVRMKFAFNGAGAKSGAYVFEGRFTDRSLFVRPEGVGSGFTINMGFAQGLRTGRMTGTIDSETGRCSSVQATKQHMGFTDFESVRRDLPRPWRCSAHNPDQTTPDTTDEILNNGKVDDDCDGMWINDRDFDDYNVYGCTDWNSGCTTPKPYDCDDGLSYVNPGKTEVVAVNNFIDEDCDGYNTIDQDSDRYHIWQCGHWTGGSCTPKSPDDCDDARSTVNRGKTEVIARGNHIDEDCDTYNTLDEDGDGFVAYECGHWTGGNCADKDSPDCNDSNAAVNPDQPEIPGNGLDDDCKDGDEGRPQLLIVTNMVEVPCNGALYDYATVAGFDPYETIRSERVTRENTAEFPSHGWKYWGQADGYGQAYIKLRCNDRFHFTMSMEGVSSLALGTGIKIEGARPLFDDPFDPNDPDDPEDPIDPGDPLGPVKAVGKPGAIDVSWTHMDGSKGVGIWLDGKYWGWIPRPDTTETIPNVPPGQHTVSVRAANPDGSNNHLLLGSATATVTSPGGDGGGNPGGNVHAVGKAGSIDVSWTHMDGSKGVGIWLDGKYWGWIPRPDTTETIPNVPPGQHTVSVRAANPDGSNNHLLLGNATATVS